MSATHSAPHSAFAYFFRRFSILTRLLIGFSIALAPLIFGFSWVTLKISKLRTDLDAGSLINSTELSSLLSGVQSGLWVGLLTTTVVGVALIVAITVSIVHPIGVLKSSTQAVAKGDLTETLDTRWTDEVGEMTRSLANMRSSLAEVVVSIHRGAQTVSVASNELAAGNASLSHRTETSAANLEETASAMEEIQAMARQSAESAKRVSELTKETALTANRSGLSLSDGVRAMEELSASSTKMVDIVSVIDSIAFQTNILALNAAVEAARAGEQGRGFAVVASEVRALASRSAASAKEIKDLIQTTIAQTQNSSRSVEAAGAEMRRLVENVATVSEHIREISNAANEQTTGIDSVSRSVSELDSVTQQNSALVEQAAAASGSLQDEAQRLVKVVSVFRLAGTTAV